jgi:hypothetical protein
MYPASFEVNVGADMCQKVGRIEIQALQQYISYGFINDALSVQGPFPWP